MKTTKRILALLTVIVLGLAPKALTVGAASMVCPHYYDPDACKIVYDPYSSSEKAANAEVCLYCSG